MVQYGKFALGDLFSITGTKSTDAGKVSFVKNGDAQFVGRTSAGYGVQGMVNSADMGFDPNEANTISVSQVGTIVAQYRDFPYYTSQNITKFSADFLNPEVGLYFCGIINDWLGKAGFVGYHTVKQSDLKKQVVLLPVTPAGEPDFEYMTMRIRELEAERIRELEAERIRELEAYLRITGLDDTTLSASEAQALTQKVQWKKFKLGSLLDFESVRQAKSQKAIPDDNNKVTRIPYIVQSMSNNMFRRNVNRQYLVDNNEPIVKGNCIALGVTLPAVSYQPDEFGGSQLIIGRAKDNWMNPETGLFLTTAIKMHMPEFSYNRKPGMKIYKNMDVELPVTPTGDIDFDYMQNYIRATEKQTIKGVVEYKDRVIKETKKVVGAE